MVLRDLVKEVQAAKYFSIICDETTDISTVEQLSRYVRCEDSAWAIEELFLGLHAAPNCDSGTLTTIVKFDLFTLNIYTFKQLLLTSFRWCSQYERKY